MHPLNTCSSYQPQSFASQSYPPSKSRLSVSLLHQNIRSLKAHLIDLEDFLSQLNYQWDFIALSEIWCNACEPSDSPLPGYSLLTSTRKRKGGGVGLLIRDGIKFSTVDKRMSLCVNLTVSFLIPGTELTCFVLLLYRPPNLTHNESEDLVQELSTLLSSFPPSSPVILTGDLNYNLFTLQPSDDYFLFLAEHNFLSLVSLPTRVTRSSSTLIDHIFINDPRCTSKSGTIPCLYSDHLTTFAVLSFEGLVKSAPTPSFPKRVLNRCYSPDALNAALRQVDWSPVYLCTEVNEALKCLTKLISGITDQFISLKYSSGPAGCGYRPCPWIDPQLRSEVNHSYDLRAIALASKDPTDMLTWRLSRTRTQSLLRKAKRQYVNRRFEHCKSAAKTWKFLNELRGRPSVQAELPSSLKLDGAVISSPLMVASRLNTYFATIGSKSSALSSPMPQPPDPDPASPASRCAAPDLVLPPCTPGEVSELIIGLKNSSLDEMGIHSSFLKDGIEHLSSPLSFLINLSINTATFPDLLKVARVVLIFKTGARDDASNYRPISILPVLSKILEKYVDKHLRRHMEEHNLWSPFQYGFRRNLNALMALVNLHEHIVESFASKMLGVGIFLDVKKAFDSVDHIILLQKLPQYGITGLTLNWLASYLANRKQYVSSNEGPSPLAQILSGVPQGSILGPSLFNIFVNRRGYVTTNRGYVTTNRGYVTTRTVVT
eukprot:Pompholyxophrys_punicea_v1_NODE_291_length_2358_cov_10.265740.p1 type:complete len:716 gc:universal NODE_291_length_2358_cov_10.265740:56-2203(+)